MTSKSKEQIVPSQIRFSTSVDKRSFITIHLSEESEIEIANLCASRNTTRAMFFKQCINDWCDRDRRGLEEFMQE
jgi:hypothetical protein